MSALTGRYSGSSETVIGQDIRTIASSDNPMEKINSILSSVLDESFWETTLPNNLNKQSTQSSAWRVYQMAQVFNKEVAWLSENVLVETVMLEEGNIHHIFPKAYLQKHGFTKQQYNQLANYTWVTQPKNLEISDQAPIEYMHNPEVVKNMSSENNTENAIPDELTDYTYQNYETFLAKRRQLIAQKIRCYYEELG